MKIAITSCWHIRGDWYAKHKHWLAEAYNDFSAQGVGLILHCGDVFHHPWIAAKMSDRYVATPDLLHMLTTLQKKHKIPMFVVPGNHDLSPAPHLPSTSALEGIPYIGQILDTPFTIDAIPNTSFLGVGWKPRMLADAYTAHVQGLLRQIPVHHDVVVYSHLDIAGHSSDLWPVLDPSEMLQLRSSVRWFCGHNHTKREYLGGEAWIRNSGVYQVGALYRMSFGEADNPCGYYVYDTKTKEVTWRDIPGPQYLELSGDASAIACAMENAPLYSTFSVPMHVGLSVTSPTGKVVVRPETDASPSLRVVIPLHKEEIRLDQGLSPALRSWGAGIPNCDIDTLVRMYEEMVVPRLSVKRDTKSAPRLDLINSITVGNINITPDKHRWTILVGPTGCGKSTLLEGVYAGLFGSWPSPGRSDLFGFCAAGAATKVEVSVIVSGVELCVTRNRTASGNKALSVWVDKVLYPATQIAVQQAKVFSLVGDPVTWLQTVMSSQALGKDLIELKPADRLRAFQVLLGLDVIEEVQGEVRNVCSDLGKRVRDYRIKESRQQELAQYIIPDLHVAVSALEAENSVENWQEILVSDAATREVIALEQQLKELGCEDVMRHLIAEWFSCIRNCEAECDSLSEEINALTASLELERDVTSAEKALLHVGCRGSGYLPCPHIDQLREKVGYRSIVLQQFPTPDCVQQKTIELRNLTDRWRETKNQIQSLQVKIRAEQANLEHITRLREKLAAAAAKSPDGVTTPKDQLHVFAEKNRELGKLKHEIALAEQEYTELSCWLEGDQDAGIAFLCTYSPYLDLIDRAFSRDGLSRLVLLQKLPKIQAYLDYYTHQWFPTYRVAINYATDSSTAVPTVLVSVNNDPWCEAISKSCGQRALVSLLVRVAISSWLADEFGVGVLILDEPTANMSDELCYTVADMLKSIVGEGKRFCQGLMATHDEVLANVLGNTVHL